jgi:hypothetical protein
VGETLRVEGVLGGSFPWSSIFFDESDPAFEFLPSQFGGVPYRGLLTIDTENAFASFEVDAYTCAIGSSYCVKSADMCTGTVAEVPSTYRLDRNLFDGIVQNDADGLVIEYTSPRQPGEWVTSFALTLDKTTREGEWRWSHGPANVCVGDVCAPSVPPNEAGGTISGFRGVPEPESLVLALIGLLVLPRGSRGLG